MNADAINCDASTIAGKIVDRAMRLVIGYKARWGITPSIKTRQGHRWKAMEQGLTTERPRMRGRNILKALFAFSFLAAATTTSVRAEQIDDPGYTYWAKFKPGSFSTTTTESDLGAQKMSMQMTTTLVSVTPEKVTVEVKTTTSAGGRALTPQLVKKDVSAKRPKPPNSTIKESKETVDVAVGDKTYPCHLVEETRDAMVVKVWMNEKIPGGVVKMEMNTQGMAMTTHLVEFGVK
ncbi:MAG TPA: hypothetical protein VH370_25565 [Humisphaera sp.]|nr:hypothetical protein [Humisphaera sp.]